MRASLAAGLLCVAGCSYDFGSFGQGGAASVGATGSPTSTAVSGVGATSSGGPSSTAGSGGGATSTGAGGATSASASATASSSAGAGGGGALAPCGLASDTFSSLDLTKWVEDLSIASDGNTITATVLNGGAGLRLLSGATYDECYTSILVLGTPSDQNGLVELGITDLGAGNLVTQFYDQHSPNPVVIAKPVGTTEVASTAVTHLGVAFHAGTTHFLYADGTGWHDFAQAPRASFQDDILPDYVFFKVVAMDGKTAIFDDFNVRAIGVADLQ